MFAPIAYRSAAPLLLAGLLGTASACLGETSSPDDPAPETPAGPTGGSGNGNGVSAPAGSGAPPTAPSSDMPPPAPGTGFTCQRTAPPGGPPRLWLLTATQYARSIATLFSGRSPGGNRDLTPPKEIAYPFGYVNESDRFSTRAASYLIRGAELSDAINAAESVATQLTQKLMASGCLGGAGPYPDCVRSILKEKGELLFRRPLSDAELSRYTNLATQAQALAAKQGATALALQSLLMAPQFLYRTETGVPVAGDAKRRKLTAFEVASALAFSLTDGPPDQPLWQAALDGSLASAETIAKHVQRLLEAPADAPTLSRFVRQQFRYDQAADVEKPGAKGHNPAALVNDTEALVKEVVTNNTRKDFIKALLHTRGGILAQPSWLVAHSQPERNDVPRRGRFVRESLLCGVVPEVMIETIPAISEAASLTLREKLVMHTANPSCRACHDLMDPIGFGFEGFDHLGRARTTEANKPVNAAGVLAGAGSVDGPFVGAQELQGKLAGSPVVTECLLSHSFEYWMGRKATVGDGCALTAAQQAYASSGGDYVAAVTALFTSDAFLLKSL